MNRWFDEDEAWVLIREQLHEQGLPETVEDPETLRNVARLMLVGRSATKKKSGRAA